MLKTKGQRLREIARQIQALTEEMEKLLREEAEWADAEWSEEETEQQSDDGGLAELERGAMVVVVAKDQYRGRVGKVVGQRGKMFWRVKLQATRNKPAKEIYKLGKNLRVVAN
jgi:ElaB/YqjD/DUF883 family membrane-anchored ribosome-binding protein